MFKCRYKDLSETDSNMYLKKQKVIDTYPFMEIQRDGKSVAETQL